jgi:hypothetical protein
MVFLLVMGAAVAMVAYNLGGKTALDVTDIESVAAAAAGGDGVLVVLGGDDSAATDAAVEKVLATTDRLAEEGTRVAMLSLPRGSAEHAALLKQVPAASLPCVVAVSGCNASPAVTGEITEAKLIRAVNRVKSAGCSSGSCSP